MDDLLTIELNSLVFFAYHGLYPEEKKTGNDFLVDCRIGTRPDAAIITRIEDTINYTRVYEIIKDQMIIPTALLETVAMEIAHILHREYPHIKSLFIRITKINPPIPSFQGNVSVVYEKNFS